MPVADVAGHLLVQPRAIDVVVQVAEKAHRGKRVQGPLARHGHDDRSDVEDGHPQAGPRSPGRRRRRGRSPRASGATRAGRPASCTAVCSRGCRGPGRCSRRCSRPAWSRVTAGVLGADPPFELRPVDEVEQRLAAEPSGNSGGQSAHRHGLLGDHVEARPDRGRTGQRPFEGLSDVVGVDVVQDAEPEIGQGERFAGGQPPPDVGVQVAGGGDDRPARTADVPRVQHHARYPARDRLPVQQRLDRHLARAVLAIGGTRLVLGDRHPRGRAMDPDGAAVHQQRPGRPEGVDQLLRRRRGETDHVDDGVGTQARRSGRRTSRPRPRPPGRPRPAGPTAIPAPTGTARVRPGSAPRPRARPAPGAGRGRCRRARWLR